MIIATALRYCAVMVSDRAVTLHQPGRANRIYDPAANKTVIFIGSDAVLIFGFTGHAYLDDIPTDQWIAQELWGAPIIANKSGTIPMVGARRPGFARINDILYALREKLKATRGGFQVEIAAVGYRYRRNRLNPVLISFSGADGDLASPLMKMRPAEDRQGREGIIGFIPSQAIINDARSEAPKLSSFTEMQLASHLASIHASTIRKAAATTVTVGTHVMKVLIPTSHHWQRGRGPWQRRIVCKFEPYSREGGEENDGTRAFGAPSSFSPWIVSDHGFQPAAITGTMGITRNFAGWDVELSQTQPSASHLGVFTAQRRPPKPR